MVPRLSCACVLTLLLLLFPVPAQAESFALPDGRSLTRIDFDRHVHAVLNKQGCNAGGCHGALQAKGGFALSLFSGSPAQDYVEIVHGSRGRRIDLGQPDASLLLLKAVGHLNHGGGKRLDKDSYSFRLLRQWIQEGAQRQPKGSEVVRLEVLPREHCFTNPKENLKLRVFAEFADGSREDVTLFTDFRTPEPEVVHVTPQGWVRGLQPGFGPVLAFYRNQVAPMTVLVSWPAPQGCQILYPSEVNYIDREVFALLHALNLPTSALASDSEFLRRVYLDVIGSLPTPNQTRSFLASKEKDKRRQTIEELLTHPLHADLWARHFGRITKLQSGSLPLTHPKNDRWVQMAHDWFRQRLKNNEPIHHLFRDVLLATSREHMAPEMWVKQVRYLEEVNPFQSVYSQRSTLDLFWRRHHLSRDLNYQEEMADRVAAAFLGVPLDCARCHHHPLAPWSNADRLAFANVFGQMRLGTSPPAHPAILQEKARRDQLWRAVLPVLATHSQTIAAVADHQAKRGYPTLLEVFVAREQGVLQLGHPETKAPLPARILGGPTVMFKTDARADLFHWLTAGEQPPLARVFVNRVWKHYFGKGLVEPEDIFLAANPPTHPRLLDALTRDFVANGYDLRRLERTILLSRTYQLSSTPIPGYEKDRWFPLGERPNRVMSPIALDVMADALGGHDPLVVNLPSGRRVIEVVGAKSDILLDNDNEAQTQNEALDRLFGRQELMSRCRQSGDWGIASYSGMSRFGELVTKSQRIKMLLASKLSVEQRAEELFLATLVRFPTPKEMEVVRNYVGKSGNDTPAAQARPWEDILWALINTKEFLFRR